MRSYRPEELFEDGAPTATVAAPSPTGDRRKGANPHANGGRLRRDLDLGDFRSARVHVRRSGAPRASRSCASWSWLRDVVERNPATFRIMGPDETASNRLSAVFEVTDRVWMAEIEPGDDHQAAGPGDGGAVRAPVPGLARGYLLTGRHGLFNCYEAFTHIVDSMVNQHAKWLKVSAVPTGGRRSRHSPTCCRATSGARTTTASRTRIRASSTTW